MTNVLVEGGGRVLGAFLDAGQVDAVEVFLAPIIEGAIIPGRRSGAPAATLMDRVAPAARHRDRPHR